MRQPPNIIFLISDDTDFHNLGCYGGTGLTPNIDRLSEERVRFTDFHSPSPVCTPSRYCALTGQYGGHCRHPVFKTDCQADEPYRINWNLHIDKNELCVGRVLSRAGYRTGFIGKHHAGDTVEPLPLPDFDECDDPEHAATLKRMRQRLRTYLDLFDSPFPLDADPTLYNNEHMRKLQEKTRSIGTGYIDWWPQSWSWDSPCQYYGTGES